MNLFRRTKIVATLGPSSDSLDILKKMIAAGINVVRLNFSHGSSKEHIKRAERVRQAAQEMGQIVGVLADLQGPKIRIAKFKKGKVFLKEGDEFTLDASLPVNAGDKSAVGIDYKELPSDIKANDVLLLNDGRIVLIVKQVDGPRIICQVTVGGELSDNKGINLQGGGLSAPALTDKDKQDLKTAVAMNVDYVAVSFVKSAADINEAKKLIAAIDGDIGVIAKIERIEALVPDILDEIIRVSDGIMVARGDLAVEIGDEQVPAVQKRIIHRTVELNKPVITATQMLETMIHSVTPTRAEVSDVANAVLDNTDAVMLSAESAVGDYPDLVVRTMSKICLATERDPLTKVSTYRVESFFKRVDEAISMATMYTANHMSVKAIIALTESGATPLWMSRIRSDIPIFGLSRHSNTLGRMTLYRDVYPLYFDVTKLKTDNIQESTIAVLKEHHFVKEGDLVVITRGPKEGVPGGTNSMTIVEVGKFG
ncbi:MAG: pyruvate kinase [Coxiella sp. DG_40]|nr:MAG: pyruvate kinase [Coxiella sp. DG_40]